MEGLKDSVDTLLPFGEWNVVEDTIAERQVQVGRWLVIFEDFEATNVCVLGGPGDLEGVFRNVRSDDSLGGKTCQQIGNRSACAAAEIKD